MKRVYIAGILLSICATFCIVSFLTITKDCHELIDLAEAIEQSAQSDESDSLGEQAQTLKAMWNKDSLAFSLLTTHIHYDTLEECVDKLYHACKSRDKAEILRVCEDLEFEATHIITSIQPKAENIF